MMSVRLILEIFDDKKENHLIPKMVRRSRSSYIELRQVQIYCTRSEMLLFVVDSILMRNKL